MRPRIHILVLGLLVTSGVSQGSLVGSGNIYFGHLHNHTSLSDGAGTPAQAYSTAKAAGLDFFGLSDHGEQLTADEFAQMQAAADAANEPDVFSTFYGFEWSSSAYGHITVVKPATFASASNSATDTFGEFISWLNTNGGVAFFNHPGRNNSYGTEFEHFTGAYSGRIVGMELWNKDSILYYNNGYTSDGRDRSGHYDEALLNGWFIGAGGSQDHHGTDWGGGSYRLAVISGSNTRDAIYDALSTQCFYSTLDKNLELSFQVDGHEMGSGTAGGSNQCVVRAADRDGEGFSQVDIIQNGYTVHTEYIAGAALPVVTHTLSTQPGDYIYCKVTQTDGDEAFSSPVFITRSGPDGPPRADLAAPLDNGPADLQPADDQVTVNTTQPNFQIQLTDFEGIADGTVTSSTVSIAAMVSGTNYTFAYDGGTDIITLTPADAVFGNGTYAITVSGISDVASPPSTMAATTLTVLIDTSIVAPQTLHFQQGLNAYAGTADTMVCAGAADTSFAGTSSLNVDTFDLYSGVSQVLLRFGSIVGSAADQIPPGASISSATLRLNSLGTGNGGHLHAMLKPWSDTDTWNSLINGVAADDVEARSVADASTGATSIGDVDLNVTGTVQSWVNGTLANNGWVVLPIGTDGSHIASAEYGTADYRPELIVTFVASGGDLGPVANAGPDQRVADDDGDNKEWVTLDGSASSPAASIVSYLWTHDGVPVANTSVAPNILFTPGVHTAVLKVTDNVGATATDAVIITVTANQPPTAKAGADQTVADAGGDGVETVVLDGSKSTDADGFISLFVWTVDGQVIEDTYGLPGDGIVAVTLGLGSHTAQLTVTDNGLLSATDTAAITVEVPSLFQDNFESGGLSAGGWVAGGQATADTTSAHGGTYGVLLKRTSYVQTTIDTGGATGATFTYWARTAGLRNEYLFVEWSEDGSTWYPLNTLTGTSDWTLSSHDLSLTQPAFMIRFRTNGNAGSDLAMIDDVVIRAAAGGNTAPVASDDTATTNEDSPVVISVLANDTDADGDTLSVTSVTQGSQGAVTTNGTTVTYTPNANVNGPDSFTYTISDGRGGMDTATVTVTINPVDDLPVAGNDSATTAKDTAVTINVLANDSHVDGILDVVSVSAPAHGSATLNADETITYTPATGYIGGDSFSYTLAGGVTATVTVTVQGAATMHVGGLDGTGALKGNSGQWSATVTVTVVDGAGTPVSGATVAGAWSGAASSVSTGVTGSDGKVSLTSANMKSGTLVTFSVTNVVHSSYTYDPAANVRTSTTVNKP